MSNPILDRLMADVCDKYGQGSLVTASAAKSTTAVRRVRSGILSLDVAFGGGVPVSRMFQLRGEWSSGKTLTMLKIMAAFQRYCRNCGKPMNDWNEITQTATLRPCCRNPEPCRVALFDAEGSWEKKWASKFGVDSERVLLSQTEFAEEAIDIGEVLIRSGEVDLFVVDSVAQLVPSKEVEESTEKWQMGLQARLINKAMRKWVAGQNEMRRTGGPMGCTIGIINQVRSKIGVMFGSPETSPGGRGLDFACSAIGRTKAKGIVEDSGGRPIAHQMATSFQKNKTAPPRRTAEYEIAIAPGTDRAIGASDYGRQLLHLASYWGIIKASGAFYEVAKGVKLQGEAKAVEYLHRPENHKLVAMLTEAVYEKEVAWLDA